GRPSRRNNRGKARTRSERERGSTERERIPEGHPVQLRRQQAPCTDRERQSEKQPDRYPSKRALQHHLDHFPPICAELHAQSNFIRTLSDLVRGDSIEPHRREYQRNDSEKSGEA